MENAVDVAPKENDFIDITKNLTIEQMLVRAYRQLSPEHQAELTAISRRTGIYMNALLKEALDIGLPKLKRELEQSLSERTEGGAQ